MFRGILVLKDIKWLTELGQDTLERELRKREIQARRRGGHDDADSSRLKLKEAFRVKGEKPKIWVQGIKSSPAVFMAGKYYHRSCRLVRANLCTVKQRIAPNGLYWQTTQRYTDTPGFAYSR